MRTSQVSGPILLIALPNLRWTRNGPIPKNGAFHSLEVDAVAKPPGPVAKILSACPRSTR
jgi:hypothetical protein